MISPFTDLVDMADEEAIAPVPDMQIAGPFADTLSGAESERTAGDWPFVQRESGHDPNQYLSRINVAKAQKANDAYQKKGTWGTATRDAIVSMLASKGISRGDQTSDAAYFAAAVAKFQSLNGLSVDGILGPLTFAKLKETVPVPVTGPSPQRSRWHQFIKNTTLCAAEPLVYGRDTFKAMVSAIRSTERGKGHFIYILGWMFDIDFPLIPNDKSSTMRVLLKEAAAKEVEIRIMIWNNPYYDKEITEAESAINNLGNAVVVRDNVTYGSDYISVALATLRNRIDAIPGPVKEVLDRLDIDTWESLKKYAVASNEGSHHEKVIIVKNVDGLVGFCGGVDINPDRVGAYSQWGMPWPIVRFDNGQPVTFPSIKNEPMMEILHDVHCSVRGYGAYALLQRFLWRWRHFKAFRGSIHPVMNNNLLGENEKAPAPGSPGKGVSNVKILHTYNSKNKIDFSRSIFKTVETAIHNAEKSVHFECQYMISVEIAALLHNRIIEKEREGSKFTVSILTQEDKFARSDIHIIKRMRKAFIDALYGSIPRSDDRIKIWVLDTSSPFPAHHKVHSKVYIIDRELVIIGSANCSRRSMTYDSETAAVIFNDPGYTNDFVANLESKYDRISHWKRYSPDANVKDVDEELVEKVDDYMNTLSIGSVVTALIAGIGGRLAITAAVKGLSSALPGLLRPIEDPYDARTKVEQELAEATLSESAESLPEELPEVESLMPFADEFAPETEGEVLSGVELDNAVKLNEKFKVEYKWEKHLPYILPMIGISPFNYLPALTDPKKFAIAFAEWQEKNGYKTSQKGVLGLNNWTYFQKKLGLHQLSNEFGIDVKSAVEANKKYASQWQYAKKEIIDFLNRGLPLNDEYFAYMIAKYQHSIHPEFNEIRVDGILGTKTWDVLRTRMERANPGFDIKQHIPVGNAKAAAERYVEELSKYSMKMISALTRIEKDINDTIRNEPIKFDTARETIYAIANGIVGAVPLIGSAGNAMLDFNKEYWKSIKDNIDRQFEKERSLTLTNLLFILQNHVIGQDSKDVIEHDLLDKMKYSGKPAEQVFNAFTNEIERIARLNRSTDEIMKLAVSNLIAAFSPQTRMYVDCQNTTDFKGWTEQDISNILKDTKRVRLHLRFTDVHPKDTVTGNALTPVAVKNLGTLWQLLKNYNYSLKDIRVKKEVFFRINLPLSLNLGMINSRYTISRSFYLCTLMADENWTTLNSILNLPYNEFWLPGNQIVYNDEYNAVSRHLLAVNDKGLVYQDIILNIANGVMANEYDRPVGSHNIGVILKETDEPAMETIDEIVDEMKTVSCEGHTCWAKSVLNKLSKLSMPLNNTIDDVTRNAIADFQAGKNIPLSKKVDAVTERALLEADAIERKGAEAAGIIAEAKTRIEDWTSQGLSGVKSKPQHILNSFRDPRKVYAFVLHQMAFKRKGRQSKQYSDPSGYVNTGAHFCIMLDGRIIQLHPFSRMIWHGNCISPRSVAVEFEGNFPNVKGKWWIDKDSAVQNKDLPTQAQYDSGRFLAKYLKTVLDTTHILAHRQSSDSRENDPGPDIWYHVGEWAVQNLGMSDGGANFKCGTGNPILAEWRTWGDKSLNLAKEVEEMVEETGWGEASGSSVFADAEDVDEGVPGGEDFILESDNWVADLDKAVRLNRYYANKLGWTAWHDQLNDLLLPYSGQRNVSLNESDLAAAAAQWQQLNGLNADGVIGPDTWAKMKPLIQTGKTNILAPTGTALSLPPAGVLGRLTVDTSVPALSKSFAEYRFTPEDAVWLARFVEGEAGGQDNRESHAVIWAMFNRFGILRHRVPSWTSFAVFLQKYSTTLQPLLNSKGAAERVWMNHKSNPNRFPVVFSHDTYPGTSILKVQYKRHIDLQKKEWDAFSTNARNMIVKILTGQIPNPGIGIATHFDSTYVLLKTIRRKQGIVGEPTHEEWRQYTIQHAKDKNVTWIGEMPNLDQKKNAFYIQPDLKDVPHNALRILGPAPEEFMYEEDLVEPVELVDYIAED